MSNTLTKTTSRDYQRTVIDRSKAEEYWALLMEQGTGKTHVAIATANHLFNEGKINAVLVIAPNGVHDNWARDEIPLHSAADNLILSWHASDGVKKRRRFMWRLDDEIGSDPDTLLWLCLNVEASRSRDMLKALFHFVETNKVLVIVDESTIIKNHKALQSKGIINLGAVAAYRRILTGTPVSQGPLDLWGQCQFLSPQALPYRSWTAFKAQYAVEQVVNLGPGRPSFQKIVGYRNQHELATTLAKFSSRVLKADVLDLPPKVYQKVYVDLTSEQKRIYDELVKQAVSWINETDVLTVTTALERMMRLHQVVLGYAPSETKDLIPIDQNRIQALSALVSREPKKTIIFCRFREDVRRVVEALNEDGQCVQYHGGIDIDQRGESIRQFQSGDAQFFVATKAASRGLTLTAAESVIYYSQGYSLEDRLQSEDRPHRIGQTKTVVYVDLIARKTIEEKIIQALIDKKNIADVIVDKKGLQGLLTLEANSDDQDD